MRLLLGERLLSRVVHFLAASDDLKRAINQWALQRIRLWVVNSEVLLTKRLPRTGQRDTFSCNRRQTIEITGAPGEA
jgi:hypothetical protein